MTDRKVERRHREAAAAAVKPDWRRSEELAKLRTKHDEMKAGAVALAATLGPRIVELEEQLKAKETELRATEDALTSARDKLAGLAKESAQKYGITASFNDLCGRHYELERAVFDGDGPDDQKPDERNATAIAAVHSLREQLAKAQGELERRHQNHARLEHERCALRDLIREFSDYCKDSGWHNLGEELMRRRDALYDGDATPPPAAAEPCACHACKPQSLVDNFMRLCPECGNKRCPKATNHRFLCTKSNEPGQGGSFYGVLACNKCHQLGVDCSDCDPCPGCALCDPTQSAMPGNAGGAEGAKEKR